MIINIKGNKKAIVLFFLLSIFLVVAVIIVSGKKEAEKIVFEPHPSNITINDKRYIHTTTTEEACDKKENKEEKELCIEQIKKRKIITETLNMKECLGLSNLTTRNECLFYLITTYDRRSCWRIMDPELQEKCLINASTNDQDVKYCEYFKDKPNEYLECKDRVLSYVYGDSKEKEDIKKCSLIKSLEYPKLCYDKAFKSKFGNDCNNVPKDFQDYCFAERILSIATDKEHCSFIKLDEYKRLCLIKIDLGGDLRRLEKVDSDNDKFPDGNELFTTTDPDNPDTDGDGLIDGDEMFVYYTNPRNPDTDSDGLSDYDEIMKYKTDSNKPDTDGDGIKDGDEIKSGTDPFTGDSDRDGLSDSDETKFGTNPNNSDTDSDGRSDFEETQNGFDPLRPGQEPSDTDKDGLLDVDEIFYGTDRFNPDTDGDGINDKQEVDDLTNPLGPGDMDFDGDGIIDKDEIKYGTNPTLVDEKK